MLVAQKESVCDVCHCCTRLMKTKLNTPTSSGRFYPRRLLSDGSPQHDENNPPPNSISPSKFTPVKSYLKSRVPLEDQDPNSQDSGYAVSEDSKSPALFRFAEPSGFAPRRLSTMESPRRNLLMSSYASSESNHSSCSLESADDSFLELFQGEKMEEDSHLPSGLGNLLSGTILGNREDEENRTTPVMKRSCRQLRRCMSENNYSRTTSVRRSLINNNNNNNSPDEVFSLKRPLTRPRSPLNKRQKPLLDHTAAYNNNNNIEKTKGTLFQYGFTKTKPAPEIILAESPRRKQRLFHSLSDSGMSIKMALQRSTEENLIGDLTRPFALPLTSGKHNDLKAISCETLGKLMNGEYDDRIGSYRIIDCRYPYEYEGGHIKGAVNLYTQEQIRTELVENRLKKSGHPESNQTADSEKRHILVFHCEFSSERGPTLSRYLRKEDRAENSYPALHYPELYLLHGGYSAFFQTHSHLCEPRSYKPMYDPAHTSEFKHFRAKSKTWAPGSNKRAGGKGLARLGF